MNRISRHFVMLLSLTATSATAKIEVYRYLHLDVFTDETLTGNQLAVFLDPAGLSSEQMMAITREMAFSETTFVYPPETEGTDFRVRIFANNLGREIQVAGHPTIGTAFALAEMGRIPAGKQKVTFGLGIGPTPLELQWESDRLQFVWMQQRPPEFGNEIGDRGAVASALMADEFPVQQVSCGAPFLMVPLRTREAVDRALLDRQSMGALMDEYAVVRRGVMVFSPEAGGDGATVYSRMFGFGVVEDPATGNASGPLGSYLVRYGLVERQASSHIVSRQGVKMGRPSRVHIRVRTEGEAITEVLVGGSSALVGEGTIRVRR